MEFCIPGEIEALTRSKKWGKWAWRDVKDREWGDRLPPEHVLMQLQDEDGASE
jgi:hypothetical protein